MSDYHARDTGTVQDEETAGRAVCWQQSSRVTTARTNTHADEEEEEEKQEGNEG